MKEETKPKSVEPIGAATYIETIYGTRTFARALMLDDAQSIMDLMNDFSDHNSSLLQSRIVELEAREAKYKEALNCLVDLSGVYEPAPGMSKEGDLVIEAVRVAQQALKEDYGKP